MGKIGKRELIILGVMVIVIAFGAYEFFSSKKKAAQPDMTAQKTAELNTFVASLNADLGKGGATSASDTIYLHAAKEWQQDPFVDSSAYNAWAKISATAKGGPAAVPQKAEFAYNGYLMAGKQKIAVINGMEYKEGEALDIRGFVLKSISPEWVVIENRGTRAMLNIPLQD